VGGGGIRAVWMIVHKVLFQILLVHAKSVSSHNTVCTLLPR